MNPDTPRTIISLVIFITGGIENMIKKSWVTKESGYALKSKLTNLFTRKQGRLTEKQFC
jgi:hypothetical protein